jgi:hypothetical protein
VPGLKRITKFFSDPTSYMQMVKTVHMNNEKRGKVLKTKQTLKGTNPIQGIVIEILR